MNTNALITHAKKLFDSSKKRQAAQIGNLRQVLQQLKKKKLALKEKLDEERNEKKRAHIERELNIIRAQRKRGLAAIKKLKVS